MKMSSGTFWLIIIISVIAGLVLYKHDREWQEKFDKAYELVKFQQDTLHNVTTGLIDSENATLSFLAVSMEEEVQRQHIMSY